MTDEQVEPSESTIANVERGLSSEEVQKRLREYGYNEIPEKRRNPVILFMRKFWGITPWMLELTAVLTWVLRRELETYVVLGLLIFNGILGFFQESRANTAVESLKQRLRVTARVKRDGAWVLVPAREIVPGDFVRLRAGDFVPADIRIVGGVVEIDQAALTGESLPVEKGVNATIFSGSLVRRWESTGVVTATGVRTYFGKTVELVQMAKPRLHMEQVTSRVVRWLLAMVAILILASLLFTIIRGGDVFTLLTLSVVLLLSAIPVALPTMFTISMAIGSLSLAKKGVLVTRLSAGEDAATMDVLCVDKTGTLTMNRLFAAEIVPFAGRSKEEVVRFGCLASQEANQDPIDIAMFGAARDLNMALEGYLQRDFVPFDPSTRWTRASVEKDGQRFLVWKGAVGAIGSMVKPGPELQARISTELSRLWHRGYRVIAVAVGPSDSEAELAGIVALADRLRPDSPQLIRELHETGVRVKMLTGDALAVARETAIDVGLGENIVEISELKKSPDEDRRARIVEESGGFAEIYPEDKYLVVSSLQGRGHVVGMTGDGVNDAPALRQAEVGIAVSNATDIAKSSSSVVLTKEGLGGIVDLIKSGRMIHQRIVTWIMNKVTKTFQVVVFAVLAFLLTGEFVVSVLSMVLFLFVTDFVTLAISTDRANYSTKPEKWDIERLVRIAVLLGVLTVAESFLLLYAGFHFFALESDVGHLHTFTFAYLVFLGVLNVLILRERDHFWKSRPSNTLLAFVMADIVVVGLLAAVGLPQLPAIPLSEIAAVLAFSIVTSFTVNDFVKVLLIKRLRSDS